jgi:hypothetical protein
MTVKLVRTVTRAGDGALVVNDGSRNTIADAFLSKGWKVLAVLPGSSSNEVVFVLQQDENASRLGYDTAGGFDTSGGTQ